MKKVSIFVILMLCATVAHANDIATSQAYVDSAAAGLQDNLPAKTSDKVVTYTTTAGATGEREIKTELGNESTNQADAGIPTVGTVKTAVNAKQVKIQSLPDTNVVTYTTTSGTPTVTPIYDDTVNTFDNGLVTAKTLNDAVIAGVNAEVTRIYTPKGTLWQFNRTAPKVLPTTANLPATIDGTGVCYKRLKQGEKYINNIGTCSNTLYADMDVGDWGVVFPHETGVTYSATCSGASCGKEIRGISVCGTNIASNTAIGAMTPRNTWATLDNQYATSVSSGEPGGMVCYCRVSNPINGAWIKDSISDASYCATVCAYRCAIQTELQLAYRTLFFSASSLPTPAQSE